ncbi:hypothetical protein FRC08_012331 [Ceratobasidium sp. 394]|nr:hypothetical protein FRC08_012331 [Ceratobasidium sp. 394]KAG9099952.1 hypothetical protein FS749_016650 [Ceratobasidium sp. UAMH 11750]
MAQANNLLVQLDPQDDPVVQDEVPVPAHPVPEPEPPLPGPIAHIPAELGEIVEELQQLAPLAPNPLLRSLMGLEQVGQDEGDE